MVCIVFMSPSIAISILPRASFFTCLYVHALCPFLKQVSSSLLFLLCPFLALLLFMGFGAGVPFGTACNPLSASAPQSGQSLEGVLGIDEVVSPIYEVP